MEENDREKDDLNGERAENNSPKGDAKKMKDEDISSFGEIWAEKEFEGTELLSGFLNREIVIRRFDKDEGGYGPFVILDASVNGEPKLLRTSSLVVIDQLQKIGDKLPFKATPLERNGKNGMKFLSLS